MEIHKLFWAKFLQECLMKKKSLNPGVLKTLSFDSQKIIFIQKLQYFGFFCKKKISDFLLFHHCYPAFKFRYQDHICHILKALSLSKEDGIFFWRSKEAISFLPPCGSVHFRQKKDMDIERRPILFAKERKEYFHGISTSIFLFSFEKYI